MSLNNDVADAMTLNQSVVVTAHFAGLNFNGVQEIFGGIDIPFMSETSWRNIRDELVEHFEFAAMKEMEEAAALEKKLAHEAGHVINGISYITVIVDGSWMHRSYNSSKRDSLSGMACIIGQKTGRILYVGVHNKYCTICSWWEKRGLQPRQHHCYKT